VFLLLYSVSVIYDRTVLMYEGTIVEQSVSRLHTNSVSEIRTFVYYYLIDNMKLKIV
jgi:phosphoribosylformylglycinamidine (FGAM) synthase PurS component